VPLGSEHDRGAFDCGDEALNRFLKQQARQDQDRHVSVCWVLPHPENANIIRGYYTLSAYSVRLTDLPASVTRKLPRYPDVPAALLGRLAVDMRSRGRGLGEHLMLDAMDKVLTHSTAMGTVMLVVDAKYERSAVYYQEHGFIAFPSAPRRLFMHLDTIARALAPS
jgi:GNAT superfamily N-acetyltransferase